MKAYGNGAPEQCAANLLATARGEVPFDRVRGIDAANIDAPVSRIEDAAADAARLFDARQRTAGFRLNGET